MKCDKGFFRILCQVWGWFSSQDQESTTSSLMEEPVITHHPDYCQVISNELIVNYRQVQSCYKMLNFNLSNAHRVINEIKTVMNFSAITHHFKTRDVMKDLDSILSYTKDYDLNLSYTKDYDFHQAVSDYFKSHGESHTFYKVNQFNQFYFQIPYGILGVIDNDEPRFYIKTYPIDLQLKFYWEKLGLNIDEYDRKEIITINGLPVLEFLLLNNEKYVGCSHDIHIQLNQLLFNYFRRGSQWVVHPGQLSYTTTPHFNELNFGFKDNLQINVTYLAINPYEFNDTLSFFNMSTHQHKTKYEMVTELNLPTLIDSEFISSYVLNGAGIIHISKFESISPNKPFILEFNQHINQLKQLGIKKIILDLSGNLGGNGCLPIELIRYLYPTSKATIRNYYQNYPELLKYLFKKPQYQNIIYQQALVDNDILYDIYDNLILHNNTLMEFTLQCNENQAVFPLESPIANEDLVLVTDGNCFSSCALFVDWMKENTPISTYLVGSLTTTPSLLGSSIGGSKETITILSSTNINQTTIHLNITFGFPLMGIYSHQFKYQPLDLTWYPANYTILKSHQNTFNQVEVWHEIIHHQSGLNKK